MCAHIVCPIGFLQCRNKNTSFTSLESTISVLVLNILVNLLVKFILEGYVELTKTTTYSNDQTNLYFTSHKGRLDLFQILLLLSTIN